MRNSSGPLGHGLGTGIAAIDMTTHRVTRLTMAGTDTNYAGFGHPEYAQRHELVQYLSYYQQSTYQLRLVKVVFDD